MDNDGEMEAVYTRVGNLIDLVGHKTFLRAVQNFRTQFQTIILYSYFGTVQ